MLLFYDVQWAAVELGVTPFRIKRNGSVSGQWLAFGPSSNRTAKQFLGNKKPASLSRTWL